MDERSAITRLQRGDIGGLEALVMLYQTSALRAAYLVTRDEALAEDIVQAAYVRVYERIAQFDSSRPFAPWFIRIVINDALRATTSRHRLTALPDDDAPIALPTSEPDPHSLAEAAETNASIEAALGQLSVEQRAAVVLRYYVGMSEREVAGHMNLTPTTVKSRLYTARQRLRYLLSSFAPAQASARQNPAEGDAHHEQS